MRIATVAAIVVALTLPAWAHHSFSAEFDANKVVTLEGQVVMMEWVNPHSWLHIDVKRPDGSVERWKIEGGSPSVLFRLGWNRDSLPAGTKITVVGFQAKDGSLRQLARAPLPRRPADGSRRIRVTDHKVEVGLKTRLYGLFARSKREVSM
jgi:uncharacterized protein DUF6152